MYKYAYRYTPRLKRRAAERKRSAPTELSAFSGSRCVVKQIPTLPVVLRALRGLTGRVCGCPLHAPLSP